LLRHSGPDGSGPVVLPHPGMLPNGLGIASPECSRRGVTLSIGIQRVLLEIWHMRAAA
jgi:hypothetical protein